MKARDNAILAITPSADHRGYEGYFVKIVAGLAVLCTSKTDAPMGVILEGADVTGKDSIALIGGGFAGTVKVKLSAAAGTVALGTLLELTANGTLSATTDGGTVTARACEAGANNELIEAILLNADGTIVLEQSWHTSVSAAAVGATLTVTGQVKDAAGNALAGRFVVGGYFSAAANNGTPADLGTLAAGANTGLLKEVTDDALFKVLTHSDGSWSVVLTVAADGTVHTSAWVIGKAAVTSTVVDVP